MKRNSKLWVGAHEMVNFSEVLSVESFSIISTSNDSMISQELKTLATELRF